MYEIHDTCIMIICVYVYEMDFFLPYVYIQHFSCTLIYHDIKKIQYKDFSFIFNEILLYNFYFQYYGDFGRVRLNVNKYLFEKKIAF